VRALPHRAWLVAGVIYAATLVSPGVAFAQASDIRVHVDSPSPVELQQQATRHAEWQTVCSSPCDSPVRAGTRTRVIGDGLRPSGVFVLPDTGGSFTLTVRPTPNGSLVGAIVLTSAGAVAMAVGVTVALLTLATSGGDITGASRDRLTGGYTMLGLGALGVLVGVLWIAGTVHSSVQMSSATLTGNGVAAPSLPLGGWREPGPEERLLPRPATAPLFSTSF
jgi:hypothetical protein